MNDSGTNLLLIGVGGGGCRFASAAATRFGPGIQAIGFDTDAVTSRSIAGMRCMLIGATRYDGCGTGGDVVKGRTAASDDAETIRTAVRNARMAVVVTALGGGVGTGATPQVLSILRSLGIVSLCVATLPFEFEGKERGSAAQRALPVLEENTDALVAIRLDDLYAPDSNAPLSEAMSAAESRLGEALTFLWSLMLNPGYISLGPAKLASLLMQSAGRCRFAVATAEGDGRAAECVSALCRSNMLGQSPTFDGVQAVLVGVLAGSDLRLVELSDISGRLRSALPSACSFNISTVLDERHAGTIKLVALLFDSIRDQDSVTQETAADELQTPTGEQRRPRRRARADSKLSLGASGRGRFQGVEGTILNGEDLDVPTYLRRRITLDR